jgi:diadenosine tetraphosphate (Ap4A) HIT family hydrolase
VVPGPDPDAAVCTSCAIEAGEIDPPGGILFATDRWTINHRVPDGDNRWPGWLVAQPRRHVRSFSELSDLERRELGEVLAWADTTTREKLGAARLIALSLGSSPRSHLHLHLLPRFGDRFPGLDLDQPPMPDSDPVTVANRIRDDAAVGYPLADRPSGGLARAVWKGTTFMRRLSLYTPAKSVYRRMVATKRTQSGLGRVAEWYTITWLAVLAALLGLSWLATGAARSWLAAIAVTLAFVRALDVLSTVTGIVLFEAQSSRFAGVESLARTVILSVVNLAELVIAAAIALSAVSIFAGSGSFEPAINGPIDALLTAAAPIGASAAAPVSGLAKWAVLAATVIPLYAFLLIAGVIVGELSGGLNRDKST